MKVVGNELMLRIENPVSAKREFSSRGTGTALKNVRARLDAFYQSPVAFDTEHKDGQYLVSLTIQSNS